MTIQNSRNNLLTLTTSLKVLKLHNPFESRKSFRCRIRLVVNTYKGCSNLCQYCYTYSYTKLSDILNPKPKKDFRSNLEKDIQRYCSSGFPKYPVYVSSNCDPLQPIEDEHKHTLYALRKLTERGFPILVMTKNPGKLLEPDYVKAMNKSKTVIQVTIPFLNNRFEPNAPAPSKRIEAVGSLTTQGFQVAARVDPIIPVYDGIEGQSVEEIDSLVHKLYGVGVELIGSKCLRLVNGIRKMYPRLYDCLKPYYRINRLEENPYELDSESKRKLLTPVYEACNRHTIKMATCIDGRHVNFPSSIRCDGSEELLS